MIDADPGPSLRVVLADDHPLFRHGLRMLLEQIGGHRVVAEAGDGEAALAAVAEHEPDVVVMDLTMPVLSGLEATRRVVRDHPRTAVLVLTMNEDDNFVFAALRAGARGYVLKGCEGAEFLRAVRAVAAGEALFGPAVAARISAFLGGGPPGAREAFPELSDREREILDAIAAGKSNAAIAQRLHLSPKTVKNYITSIFDKLQVADRAEAIVRAREAGLGRE
ncbi:response regulator transcription factor [Microbispora sp. KK1-11]|uniref:response regulator transcription factor n=1 Tax=Microbispora sp. KK1-11 TaxID=2053005 RepID=UPI0011595C1A|nr:response regulator transcription factor [Microbispora sp. KK1-11]TQS26156.1 response regulator transcription factor [Microbispora sp. KK1-11]